MSSETKECGFSAIDLEVLAFIVKNGKVQTSRDTLTVSIVLDAQEFSDHCEKAIQKGGEWNSFFAGMFDHSRGMLEGLRSLDAVLNRIDENYECLQGLAARWEELATLPRDANGLIVDRERADVCWRESQELMQRSREIMGSGSGK